jgi:GntR family transcriptional regulator
VTGRPGRPARRTKATPKYVEIAEDLIARIKAGEFKVGERLPTKEELKAHYRASLNTVDNAIRYMVDQGWAEPHQGVGTFVTQPPPPPPEPADFQTIMQALNDLGDKLQALIDRFDQASPVTGRPPSRGRK